MYTRCGKRYNAKTLEITYNNKNIADVLGITVDVARDFFSEEEHVTRSLDVLRFAKRHRPGQITKSNLILGMGERPDEVVPALADLQAAGVDIVTMGQYLQPTPEHLPVDRWVTPLEFAEHAAAGEALGLAHVEAGPLVRSSYHAGKQLRRAVEAGRLTGAGA